MDRRERRASATTAMQAAQRGQQSQIWTALPGIIQSYNASKQTCVVQPSIQARVQGKDGSFTWTTLPLLLDCPVFFPGAGGFKLTFPLERGDEGLVVFSSRCIDSWWQSGGIQVQAEMRMHDLSDGFMFPGFASVPEVFPSLNGDNIEMRNEARTSRVSINKAGAVRLQAGLASVELNPATGGVAITGLLSINGVPYLGHTHTGVQPGPNNTGGVTP